MKNINLTLAQVKGLLPKTVRMTYAFNDVLSSALEIGDTSEIICVDDPNDKTEYIAVYKLVAVRRP
jgi:hypothetical protein